MLMENKIVSDHELWTRFVAGDDGSWEQIYRKYVNVLYRYGIQFTSDTVLVEDAIHDVFVKLYNDRSSLKKDVHVKFYLFVCVKNRLYNLLKRELFFESVDESVEHYDPTAEARVMSDLYDREQKDQVKLLLGYLSERQREIVYYRYLEELSIDEIAILTQMNYQSVQNVIQRSLKKIRESLPYILVLFIFLKKL